MNFNFLLELFAGAAAQAGSAKLQLLLLQLKHSNPQAHAAVIAAGTVVIQYLKPLADQSNTRLDNIAIDALENALMASAAAELLAARNAENVPAAAPGEYNA